MKILKRNTALKIVKIGALEPIENSDFLARTTINGFNVVVGNNDVKEGDIMLYAKLETEVNTDFLSVNNQFEIGERHLNKNYNEVQTLIDEGKDDEAKKLVGYFNKYGRVRIVKLRKCPSEGFCSLLIPLSNGNQSWQIMTLISVLFQMLTAWLSHSVSTPLATICL